MQKSLFDKLVAALKPEMGEERARRALVEGALYQSPVLEKIEWDGAAATFTKRLIDHLDRFGEIEKGRPALVALLEEVRGQVGTDRQEQIGALLAELRLRRLELAYLERLSAELQNADRYTPLRGASQQARVEQRKHARDCDWPDDCRGHFPERRVSVWRDGSDLQCIGMVSDGFQEARL